MVGKLIYILPQTKIIVQLSTVTTFILLLINAWNFIKTVYVLPFTLKSYNMKIDSVNESLAPKDTKKVFRKLGTCSRTFFFLLNREFDQLQESKEHAADSLAGGIMQKGHQCGMLWGSSLAVGAESYRRYNDPVKAGNAAIRTTQHLMDSFTNRTKTVNCREITRCDFSSKLSMAKYFFSGRFLNCFTLAEKWAPEAIMAANKGLSESLESTQTPINCASEVVKRMGGSTEESITVSGFAGGLGLSGNACGALSAAIWMKTMKSLRKQNGKSPFPNPEAKNTLNAFIKETNNKMSCCKITGKHFSTVKEHADFVDNGGCDKLMTILAVA
jgi:hypothetical protein